MPDYQKLYLDLFNRVTDIIEALQLAQQEAEADYIHEEEDEDEGEEPTENLMTLRSISARRVISML